MALLTGLLLSACAQFEHEPSLNTIQATPKPASTPVQPSGCDGLGYYQTLSGMTPDEKKKKLPLLRLSQKIEDDDGCGQLELAMLLSQPDSDFQNDAEAERLLGEFLDNPSINSDQDRALANLLRDIIQERLRSQKVQNILKRKLKKEQIASSVLKKRLNQLKSQLEQLKSLEQDINQQEQAISTPSREKSVDEK